MPHTFSFIHERLEAEVRWSLAHSHVQNLILILADWLGRTPTPTCGLSLLLKFTYNGDISWLESESAENWLCFQGLTFHHILLNRNNSPSPAGKEIRSHFSAKQCQYHIVRRNKIQWCSYTWKIKSATVYFFLHRTGDFILFLI